MFEFVGKVDLTKNVTNREINNIEKKFNIRFPEILRKYYLNYNVNENDECICEVNGHEFDVSYIIPLKYGNGAFEKEYEYTVNGLEISRDFVPFAKDGGDNTYFWNKNDKKIYFITPGDVGDETFVCDSIEIFFEHLKIVHGDVIDEVSNKKKTSITKFYLYIIMIIILLVCLYWIFFN